MTSTVKQTVLAAVLVFCGIAPAQIAPGPLSRSHQQLEGVTKCASCHEFGSNTRVFKCLECHTEIRRRVEARTGYHARNYKSAVGERDCERCHKEHNGQKTPLIKLDRQSFDHLAQTGYNLAGKHRQQKCENCHAAAKIAAAARAEIKLKDPNRSFLGLRRECVSCHKDQHQAQLGDDCARCHGTDGFKPVVGFSHAGTHYPLTGLHQTTPCQKCHGPGPGRPNAQFKGLAFTGCQSCHTDPHRGAFQEVKFRGSCDNCHNTDGWKNNHPGTEFNHTTTKFALSGKHTAVTCAKCHKGSDFHRPIAHDRCRDCHEDPHKGQFAARAAGSDCAACHNDAAFKPARFDRETHQRSALPLEGKHSSLRCAECHQPEGRDAVYISRKLTCAACHADRHGDEFAAKPQANQCDQCHTAAGFQPTTFSIARHAETQFPLTGRHAAAACEKCHKPLTAAVAKLTPADLKSAGAARALRQYHFASLTCNSCHDDPHQTKMACESCHTAAQWKEVRPFDHSTTKFKVEGAHEKVKCIQCHTPCGPGPGGTANEAPQFAKTPDHCSGCHDVKDPHAGQFKSVGREEDCSRCHTTARWKGEDFDHDTAQFVLNRVHRNVECAKCHKEQREVAGKMVRIYRGTTAECIKCH